MKKYFQHNRSLGKQPQQYQFYSCSSPIFTALHTLWYRWDNDNRKYIKIIPDCIGEMFSVISLAHWVIEYGYFDNHGRTQTLLLCTESFTKAECVCLQEVLANLGLKTTLKVRDSPREQAPGACLRLLRATKYVSNSCI